MSSEFDDLLPAFFVEARENLELLGMALLDLERTGGIGDAINDAFRAAHSLKGMAATMGFERLASLTHSMEHLLDGVRDGRIAVDSGVARTLFDALDTCALLVDQLERGDAEQAPIDALVSNIHAFADSHASDAADAQGASSDAHDEATWVAADGQGLTPVYVEAAIDPSEQMPAVRAYTALITAETHGSVIAESPTRDELELGEFSGTTMCIWMATETAVDDIRQAVAGCTGIASVDVAVIDKPGDAREELVAPVSGAPAVGASATASQPGIDRSATVRVESSRLDALMHSVGELLVRRSRVEVLAREHADPELVDAVQSLGRAAQEMQALVMDVRMIGVDAVFRRLPRMVRDTASKLGKEIDLQITGGDTELDRTVIDMLGEPLVHLVRNAIDHGIEAPDVREANGKPRIGTLAISASAEGGTVVIRVRDDGAGMDPTRIRQVAVERGVVTPEVAAAMADDEAVQLCFAAGFSTRDEATDISGRGVGLDAVRASVRSLGGDVAVETSDEGTVMSITLPLTLAILPVLLVDVGGDSYAIQSNRVSMTLSRSSETVHSTLGHDTIVFHDEVVPLVSLGARLGADVQEAREEQRIVVIETGASLIGLVVDDVLGQADVVTRAVPPAVGASALLSASAVLGDGSIAFVLDTERITHAVDSRMVDRVNIA